MQPCHQSLRPTPHDFDTERLAGGYQHEGRAWIAENVRKRNQSMHNLDGSPSARPRPCWRVAHERQMETWVADCGTSPGAYL